MVFFLLKLVKEYEINVFCGSCDGFGRYIFDVYLLLKF